MKAGVIGLGQMGSGLAASLLKAGHEVTVYNRTRARVELLLAQAPGRLMRSPMPAEAKQFSPCCRMMRPCYAPGSVTPGSSKTLAETRSISPRVRSASRCRASWPLRMPTVGSVSLRLQYLADPTWRRSAFVFAAGQAGAIDAAKPLLDAIGQRTLVVSREPLVANAVKLSCNFLIASVIESLGEAMAFVARDGVDRHDYLAMLTSTLFGAPIYTTYGKQIAGGTFSPHGFAAPLGLRTYGSCFRQRMICMRMPVTAGMSIPLAVPARSVCVRRGKSDQPGSRDSLQLILRQ
jgi:NAD binding domain of 6-phosphogluconate dehydrogenase